MTRIHPMDLSGKVAVVTGGNGGIGLGIARGLVSAGCQVGIWARNEAKNAAAGDGRRGCSVCLRRDAA